MKFKLTYILIALYLNCSAQGLSVADSSKTDIFDIISEWTRPVNQDNITVKSKNEDLSIIPGFGYSQLKGVSILVEGNYSFKNSPESKVSVIRFVPQVSFKGYILPRITSSLWFYNNRINLTTDWRFYRFLIKDFGIGATSNVDIFNNYKQNYIKFHQTIAWEHSPGLLLGIGYNLDSHARIQRLEDEVITPDYGIEQTKSTISSGIVFNFLFDNRKNENFPWGRETFASINFIQNLKAIGSTYNYPLLSFDMRKYFQVGHEPMSILAFRTLDYFIFKSQAPYFDIPFSQGDMLNSGYRPYIEGRFKGNNSFYIESDYRFPITRNKLIGGAVFFNAGTYSEYKTNKFERLLLGYGFSGRLLINKKSNLYFLLSYGWGNSGGQGFFLNLGDVF